MLSVMNDRIQTAQALRIVTDAEPGCGVSGLV
jgi:hypothetical protein